MLNGIKHASAPAKPAGALPLLQPRQCLHNRSLQLLLLRCRHLVGDANDAGPMHGVTAIGEEGPVEACQVLVTFDRVVFVRVDLNAGRNKLIRVADSWNDMVSPRNYRIRKSRTLPCGTL